MKSRGIYFVLFVFFVVGIALLGGVLIQQEKKQQEEKLSNQGNYLVSLIALHPIADFTGEKGNYILRTIREYISPDGLVYCLIHDRSGGLLASLGARDLITGIPKEVRIQSLYTPGLVTQTFRAGTTDLPIHEFSKPIYENGERSGTVRLGFHLPSPSILSPDRIKLLGIVAFFIFTISLAIYYAITLALQRLNSLSLSVQSSFMDPASTQVSSVKATRIDQVIKDFEQSLGLLKAKMSEIETSNMELETKAGVTAFYENQITNILDSMKLGIMILDSQDNIMNINVYMLALINGKRDDMVDRSVGEALGHREMLTYLERHEGEGKDGRAKSLETTFEDVAPGHLFQVTSSALKDGEGTVTGRMVLVDDVTNEKLAERAKQEFVAHVTHELYTPLTTIKSYNEMLMAGEVQDEETQREFFNTIMDETDRLQRLIENLLNISKIEMGSLTLNKSLVKSDWLVNDCIAAIETAARKKQITIERTLPDNFPSLFGDKDLLKVAIINLLGNAVKYTPDFGRISFGLSDDGDAAVFEVADTGYGINPEDLPRIFDKFYRSEDPRVAEQTGSGLGLGITSEIIHLHGGEIGVESESGQGTHFSVRIPKEEYQIG